MVLETSVCCIEQISVKSKATQMQTGQVMWEIGNPLLDLLAGGAVTWKSSKQSRVALYTEYVALSAAAQESVWL